MDTQGGSAGVPTDAGGTGRLLFGKNAGPSYQGGGTFQTPELGSGPAAVNPFIEGFPITPYIPNLLGGAEIYGLTPFDASIDIFKGIVAAQPDRAVAAPYRMDTVPDGLLDASGLDFTGFDALFLLSLSRSILARPAIGIVDPDILRRLQVGGYLNDPDFGGSGPATVNNFFSGSVWMTLIPEGVHSFSLRAGKDGQFATATTNSLMDGGRVYLEVPEPTTLTNLLAALSAFIVEVSLRKGSR